MNEEEVEDSDPFVCRLTLHVPKGKRRLLKKIISPITGWIDPSFRLIKIRENLNYRDALDKTLCNKKDEEEFLRIPSISVMSFLSEKGTECAKDVKKSFEKRPWRFHHKVELVSRRSPDHAAACQDFYGLADDMPLWSVCPIHCGNEHFRFLIYVRNFSKMVEFYRVITNAEMESNKPGFCIFQLFTDIGMDIQLALKYSKHLEPYPVPNANLVFKVKNIDVIRSTLGCDVYQGKDGVYSVVDPDGNTIDITENVSHNENKHIQPPVISTTDRFADDLKSYRSSDSHDSGRCSDSENWSSESETLKTECVRKMTDNKSNYIKDDTPGRFGYKSMTSYQGQAGARHDGTAEVIPSYRAKVEPVYL